MKRLFDLEPAEVSLVDEGANLRKFLVFKNRKGEGMTRDQMLEAIRTVDTETLGKIDKVVKSLNGEASVSQGAQAALKAAARILVPFKGEVNGKQVNAILREAGMDQVADSGQPMEGLIAKMKRPDGMDDEKYENCMKAAYGAYEEEVKKNFPPEKNEQPNVLKSKDGQPKEGEAKETKGDMVENKDKVTKSNTDTLDLSAVPEAVRPTVEAIFKSQQELVKKNLELQGALDTERKERRLKEFVAKANGFRHYVGDRAELGKQLMELSDANQPLYENVVKNLEANDAQAETVSKNLFREVGSSAGAAKGGDAWAKIEAAAEGIVQKSASKLSKAEAVEAFLGTPDGKKMYAEYVDQKGAN